MLLRRYDNTERRVTIRPRFWSAPVALLLGLLPACTFEHRSEMRDEEAPAGSGPAVLDASIPGGDAEEAARATVRLFREAVSVGDLSLALALLDPQATLVDPLVGDAVEEGTRGELVLELRRRYATGVRLEGLVSEVVMLGPGTAPPEAMALVVSSLALLQERDDGIGEQVGRMHETAVLVSTPEGWRIRHLHRSSAPLD